MANLFEEVVKATCDRDDAFLTAKLLLRNIIKETLHALPLTYMARAASSERR